MPDYAPVLTCCTAVAVLRGEEGWRWLHASTCLLSPERPITTPHGNCPLHPSEPLFECQGCIETGELRREQEEGIV